jgi:hypothetical protein
MKLQVIRIIFVIGAKALLEGFRGLRRHRWSTRRSRR